jgi:enoyl-CoA hydratase/carnithine racemase
MSLVQVKVNDHTGTIILDRPAKRNALTRRLLEELEQAFDDLHQEKRVRAVILTGAGTAFCAGMDLAEMRETAESDNPDQQWGRDAVVYRDLLSQMLQFPKPIIAAVNGPAVAGGAGLVLASDIVLAAPEASFGLPEPRRGIVAGMVSPLLVFRVGGGQAARLLLSSALIDAEEAHRIGLFHQMVAADTLGAQAAEVAKECAKGAPEALLLTKRMLNETIGEHLATLLSAGAACSATARTTEAAAEGLAAFMEKREPEWK